MGGGAAPAAPGRPETEPELHRTTAPIYLMGGGDPALRTSGASSLLMWEAIRRARSDARVFDFEGSMLPHVERFFRAFGGRQVPYFRVRRASGVAAVALALRAGAERRWPPRARVRDPRRSSALWY